MTLYFQIIYIQLLRIRDLNAHFELDYKHWNKYIL